MVSSFPSLHVHPPVEDEMHTAAAASAAAVMEDIADDEDIPQELRCPLSLELMEDPVMCFGDGHQLYIISAIFYHINPRIRTKMGLG